MSIFSHQELNFSLRFALNKFLGNTQHKQTIKANALNRSVTCLLCEIYVEGHFFRRT